MKFSLFTFEIPPDQLERITLLIERILPKTTAFVACILAAAFLVAALVALVLAWKLTLP